MSQYPNQPQQPYSGQIPSQPLQEGYVQPGPIYPSQMPYQPPPQPPRKKKGWIIALVVGLVVVLATCGIIGAALSSSTNKTSTLISTPAGQSPTSQPPANKHYKIGDTVSVESTWQVVVASAKTDPGDSQFSIPKAGNKYILINVALKNISSDLQNASGLLQFSLRDLDGNKYDESLTYSKDPGGKVASGDPLKGTLAYEAPAGTKSFVLSFVSNITSGAQTSWDITV